MANETTTEQDYNYETAGLDSFFTRKSELIGVVGLDQVNGGELNFDEQQLGGAASGDFNVGGIMYVGNIQIDGKNGKISMHKNGREILTIDGAQGRMIASDGNKRRLVLGELPGGEYGLVVSKEGYDVISEALEE